MSSSVGGVSLPDPPAFGTAPASPVLMRRASVNVAFCSKLRTTLEDGEAAIDLLLRSYDATVADHHLAVSQLALGIARGLGLTSDAARGIELASSIHDIGVIGVLDPDSRVPYTDSPDPSPTHTRAGASIVDGIRFPWPIAVMILQHHECMDGSGYPDGIRGASILVSSRVLAVADTVATRSDAVPSLDAALDLVAAGRGSRFDADVVDACLALFPSVPKGIGLLAVRVR